MATLGVRQLPYTRVAPPSEWHGSELADRLIHVAYLLDLDDHALAAVVGASTVFVLGLRVRGRECELTGTQEGSRAARLVGIYEQLSHQLGCWSDIRLWFDTRHAALGGIPRELVQHAEGLERVSQHVCAGAPHRV